MEARRQPGLFFITGSGERPGPDFCGNTGVAITARIDEPKSTRRPASLTVFTEFLGPLQGALGSRNIKMDFTFDEELVFPINHESVLVQYSDCSSVSKSLDVYSLEEILTEKLCALIGRT